MDTANSLVLITTATEPPQGVFVLEMTDISKRRITAKAAALFWGALGVKKLLLPMLLGKHYSMIKKC